VSEEEIHEVYACYSLRPEYLRHVPCLGCSCGFRAYGETWEEAGEMFDPHVAENDRAEAERIEGGGT